mmetsp:Transcript_36806/g.66178  ORF Transcript_36806/g.66178 Transcript_36806/m.66178 type:complete len:95 (-) Transcript_36806:1321-1605(-)
MARGSKIICNISVCVKTFPHDAGTIIWSMAVMSSASFTSPNDISDDLERRVTVDSKSNLSATSDLEYWSTITPIHFRSEDISLVSINVENRPMM